MNRVFLYVVDRDFGFAPNPFHGYCTLATCKSGIRSSAQLGDWVIGMGGRNLKAKGQCVYAMRITAKISFNEYWTDSAYLDKKPVRNGSSRTMVGDNIYFYESVGQRWLQADSHHSQADGSVNLANVETDTKSDKVLISRHFFYFGKNAPIVPDEILDDLGYKNGRNYRVFPIDKAAKFVHWLETSFQYSLNMIHADPFNFTSSEKRYSVATNKVS